MYWRQKVTTILDDRIIYDFYLKKGLCFFLKCKIININEWLLILQLLYTNRFVWIIKICCRGVTKRHKTTKQTTNIQSVKCYK